MCQPETAFPCPECSTVFHDEEILYIHLAKRHLLFPLKDEYTISLVTIKQEEEMFVRFFDSKGLAYVREQYVSYASLRVDPTVTRHRAYLDFVFFFQNRIVIVECNEHQHSHGTTYTTSEESARPIWVLEAFPFPKKTQLPLVYINYDPHKFVVGSKSYDPPRRHRMEQLLRVIQDDRVLDEPLKLIYLYYDVKNDGKLAIAEEIDFNPMAQDLIRDVIVECAIPVDGTEEESDGAGPV
jgi:hypothetical protein